MRGDCVQLIASPAHTTFTAEVKATSQLPANATRLVENAQQAAKQMNMQCAQLRRSCAWINNESSIQSTEEPSSSGQSRKAAKEELCKAAVLGVPWSVIE